MHDYFADVYMKAVCSDDEVIVIRDVPVGEELDIITDQVFLFYLFSLLSLSLAFSLFPAREGNVGKLRLITSASLPRSSPLFGT